MYREVDKKNFKEKDREAIFWKREGEGTFKDDIIYIFPQLGDNIKKKKYFIVKEYQKVLFYNKAELIDILGGGVYELNKKDKMKGLELVWVDTSFIKIQWGVAQTEGIPTKDGVFIGLHGDLNLRISDPKTFYNDVVAGRKTWKVDDLKNWIKSLIHTSLRDIFKTYIAKEILLEDRERITLQINAKMTEELLRYGLELESFNILGIKAPEGTEKLYSLEREKAKIEDQRVLMKVKNQLEIERRELEASKRDFEREQKIFEAKSDLEVSKLSIQTQKMKEEGDIEILKKTIEAKKVDESITENNDKLNIKQEITNLKSKLNQIDDMLTTGKISKEIYKLRVKRIEKEIDELNRRLMG